MVKKCANPACSEPFDHRHGRLYFLPMQPLDRTPPANNHGVVHHWLCGSCSKTDSFEPQAGLGVVIKPRSPASPKGQLWSDKLVSEAA